MKQSIKDIRNILRKPFEEGVDKFALLKDIAEVVSSDRHAAQELVLRVFSRREDFLQYEPLLIELVKQVGLYPYLANEDLSLRDALALEMHRPAGLGDVVFHSSQSIVYNYLMNGQNVILSAPTSYGKSLIIDSVIASCRYNNIVIIVPSIALIDETRKRLSRFKEQYKIITYPYQELKERNVLVLTQERALEVIDQIKVDFFVIDEFYKIGSRSDGDERYRILNQVFYKLVKTGGQFYLLGPSIENVKVGALANIQFVFIKTDFKTVVSERHQITIYDDNERIDRLINILNESDHPTLIYCQSPKSANVLAQQLLERDVYEEVAENTSIANWIRDNYHPDWILAKAIEHGIGIHHGENPRALSQQCVKMFNEGQLQCLICTSTLIEGVNTKAKNVVIYDNKIARNNIDFFTFNNICGRSGRMFSHFIGHVYMFKDPPDAELPMVDFPIFTQSQDVPDEMLINIEDNDLTEASRKKVQEYKEQDLLPVETLKSNSYIALSKQLQLAQWLSEHVAVVHRVLNWSRVPTAEQLKFVCGLIWRFFEGGSNRVYGVCSGNQLAYRINSYRVSGSIKQFIQANMEQDKDINDAIELSLDIQRHWINFKFPRYLRSLNQIVNDVSEKHGLSKCDYGYYATLVENYFCPPYVVPFDEYGLPVQVTNALRNQITFSTNLDEALQQLKYVNVEQVNLTDIEKYFVKNVQQYI